MNSLTRIFLSALVLATTGCTVFRDKTALESWDPAVSARLRQQQNPAQSKFEKCYHSVLFIPVNGTITREKLLKALIGDKDANAVVDIEAKGRYFASIIYNVGCVNVTGYPVKL